MNLGNGYVPLLLFILNRGQWLNVTSAPLSPSLHNLDIKPNVSLFVEGPHCFHGAGLISRRRWLGWGKGWQTLLCVSPSIMMWHNQFRDAFVEKNFFVIIILPNILLTCPEQISYDFVCLNVLVMCFCQFCLQVRLLIGFRSIQV